MRAPADVARLIDTVEASAHRSPGLHDGGLNSSVEARVRAAYAQLRDEDEAAVRLSIESRAGAVDEPSQDLGRPSPKGDIVRLGTAIFGARLYLNRTTRPHATPKIEGMTTILAGISAAVWRLNQVLRWRPLRLRGLTAADDPAAVRSRRPASMSLRSSQCSLSVARSSCVFNGLTCPPANRRWLVVPPQVSRCWKTSAAPPCGEASATAKADVSAFSPWRCPSSRVPAPIGVVDALAARNTAVVSRRHRLGIYTCLSLFLPRYATPGSTGWDLLASARSCVS